MKKSKVFTFFYRLIITLALMFGINGMLLSVVLDKWYITPLAILFFSACKCFSVFCKGRLSVIQAQNVRTRQ